MTSRIFAFFAVVALAGSVLPVHAADLAPRPMVPAPTYNWTGIYLGVNGGYGWGEQDPFNIITNRFDNVRVGFSGGTFGGTAGAQIQMAHVVLGLETDIDWASISGSSVVTPSVFGVAQSFSVNATTHINWMSTARARVGYAQDNWLFYATGGVAILGAKTNLTGLNGFTCGSLTAIGPGPGILNCSGTNKRLGGTAGAGVEYGFTPNLSAKLEYLYTAAASLELSHVNEVRAGLNYRFGGY
jgi:outer membrane immunogenic protein